MHLDLGVFKYLQVLKPNIIQDKRFFIKIIYLITMLNYPMDQ